MTRLVLDKLPNNVRTQIETLKTAYKNSYPTDREANARIAGYTSGLRDAGLITERDRQFLYIYCTL